MPLDFQLVQAPFRFGLEEGVDPKQVPFGTLLTAENVVWEKSGRLQKRKGTSVLSTSISGGGSISSAKRLIVRDDELALTDGDTLYSYVNGAWYDRGRIPNLGLTWSTIKDSTRGAHSSDMVYLSDGRIVHAWVTGEPNTDSGVGYVMYQVVDYTTGAVIVSPTILDTASALKVRVVNSGTTFLIIWATTGANLKCSDGTTTTTLRTDVYNTNSVLSYRTFDAAVVGTDLIIAYHADAAINLARWTFAAVPGAPVQTGTVTGEASAVINSISIVATASEPLFIAYVDDSASSYIKYACANVSTLIQTLAPTTLASVSGFAYGTVGACRYDATTAVACVSYDMPYASSTTGNVFGITRTYTITSSGTATLQRQTQMVRANTRPFLHESRYYVVANSYITATDLAPVAASGAETFVMDVTPDTLQTPHRQVGKIDVLVGGTWCPGVVSTPVQVSSTKTLVLAPYTSTPGTASKNAYTGGVNVVGTRQGIHLVEVTTGADLPADMWRSVTIDRESYIAAGVLTAYDGMELIGYGWAHPPLLDQDALDTSASGASGAMVAGDYIYNLVAERRSNVGVLHRSPVGIPLTVTIPGATTGSVFVHMSPIGLSYSSKNEGHIAVYRSVVGGSVVQRVTVEPLYNTTFNPSGASLTYFFDTLIDSNIGGGLDLASMPRLYTEGGELDDFQPPGFVSVAIYRGRIFGISGDRRTVWFSKSHAENPGTAPGFNPNFRLVFNDELTALSVLEDRLIIFSETGIYHLAGDGPAPNGDSSDFVAANKLQTDVGCTNARSVCTGPDGLYFVNGQEVFLLDRSLNVQWMSKRVQDQLDAFPNITSAVLVQEKNHVRFSCNNNAGSAGIVLVYDYVEQQWSTFLYGGGVAIADACMHGEVYTFVTTGGTVYKESDATYLDNGSWVTAKIETAWAHAAGPLAYHSVRNFRIDGVSMTAHGLSLSVGFNGESTYQQGPETWAEGVANVTTPGDSVTANISIGNRRKCRSIRFKVQDSAPVTLGTGQGGKWSTMGIEVGQKRGLGPLAQRQKG